MKKRVAILAVTTFLACGNPVEPGPAEPDPGFVAVSITTASQGLGAIRLTLTGGGSVVDSVRTTAFTYFGSGVSSSVHRGIVVGPIGVGEVLRFWVPDRNGLASYQAIVDEAAAGGTYAQLPASGIVMTLGSVSN